MSRHPRLESILFVGFFFAFAYFNQGGGWNQNARFAEVRAMVEEGRFDIDDFLVYQRAPDKDDLVRLPLENGEYAFDGKRYRLCWVDMEWNLFPVRDESLGPGVEKKAMLEVCSSGDIGYVPKTGHFHPNKPPGTSFLALPGYFVVYHVEKWLGLDPDHWWTLELNAWLATIFSVGLVSAAGCVLFFRLADELSGGEKVAAVLATITFAFGTTFFPFATILFDHSITASLLVASYYFLRAGRRGSPPLAAPSGQGAKWGPLGLSADGCFAAAGLCAGTAAITNYVAAVVVCFLALYALRRTSASSLNWRAVSSFSLGVLPPFVLICWYGSKCFGSPFTLNTDFQNPLFKDQTGALFGMFPIPRTAADFGRLLYVFKILTVSPMRGVFFVSPVLILSFYGLYRWSAGLERKTRPFISAKNPADAILCAGIFVFFFLVNLGFNGFHGGFSAGPRYLVPGIPFLALPLVEAFRSIRWLTAALAGLSIFSNLLLTVTDAQNPVGVGGFARVEKVHDESSYRLIGEYAWPLFFSGRDWPLLEQLIAVQMNSEEARIAAQTDDPAERARLANEMRKELRASIDRGEPSPFLLGSVEGPVSVNPIGVYEGLFTYGLFPPGSPQCRWASFNVGEWLWPQSRWSLLPLVLVTGGLLSWAIQIAARERNARE